ncbi:MAG TPA: CPBP family glutamic-type intramembrane protease [Symbiobacteriaceae bacterium]|nr:CPBP family glutamic-type intramembrane protease [Symbiobacteriaceae bacterium]
MGLNRFWGSVWGVVSYLFGVGLLQYVIVALVQLFGLASGPAVAVLVEVARAVVPIAGTLLYIDWRWNWKAAHIGLVPQPAAMARLGLGLVAGGLMAAVSAAVSTVWLGGALTMPAFLAVNPFRLVVTLVTLFGAEVVYRGAAIARFQKDLTLREALYAALLTPLLALLAQAFVGGPSAGIEVFGDLPMAVALSLLYLRTGSVWLTAGVHMAVYAAYELTSLQRVGPGHTLVWLVAAAVLLALEWFRQERMPKRVASRSNSNRGRTVRGPWGPH